jgi:hypothetical protein
MGQFIYEFDVPFKSALSHHHHDRLDGFGDNQGGLIQTFLTSFYFGQVQNVVDELEQVLAGLFDVFRVFVILVVAERSQLLLFEYASESDDRVKRRARLITHRGEKLGFPLVGGFGLGARDPIFLPQILQFSCMRHQCFSFCVPRLFSLKATFFFVGLQPFTRYRIAFEDMERTGNIADFVDVSGGRNILIQIPRRKRFDGFRDGI